MLLCSFHNWHTWPSFPFQRRRRRRRRRRSIHVLDDERCQYVVCAPLKQVLNLATGAIDRAAPLRAYVRIYVCVRTYVEMAQLLVLLDCRDDILYGESRRQTMHHHAIDHASEVLKVALVRISRDCANDVHRQICQEQLSLTRLNFSKMADEPIRTYVRE